MVNHIFVCTKLGDQKSNAGMKDGFIIDFIDPNDKIYGDDWYPQVGSRTVFCWFKIPIEKKNDFIEYVKPYKNGEIERSRSKLLRMSNLPQAMNGVLRNKNNSEKVFDLTRDKLYQLKSDGTEKIYPQSNIIDFWSNFESTETLNPEIADENSISSGTHNIGSGETYTTRAQFCADLTTLTGDLTGTVTTDTIESAQSVITIDMSGYTLEIASSSPHLGNPNLGHTINDNFQVSNTGALNIVSMSGGGNIKIHDLTIDFVDSSSGSVKLIQSSTSQAFTLSIYNMILKCNKKAWRCIDIADDDIICNFYNLYCYGANLENISLVCSASSVIENCTIHDGATGIYVNSSQTLRNVVCHDNNTNYNNMGSATGESCATTDAGAIGFGTESGTVNNITDSDFISVSPTNDSYLSINSSSALYGTGITGAISGHTAGINDVEWGSIWDIGAYAVSRSVPPGTILKTTPKIRYEGNTLTLDGVSGPVYPNRLGATFHTYLSGKREYTATNRYHGTSNEMWSIQDIKCTKRDEIWSFWDTTMSKGYNDVTLIDDKNRMLFDASWNEWDESWTKQRGGLHDIGINYQSPGIWTNPLFGAFLMSDSTLDDHLLTGNSLSTVGGSLVTNSTDSNVSRLSGSAIKINGSNANEAASGSVSYKSRVDGSISIFFQFLVTTNPIGYYKLLEINDGLISDIKILIDTGGSFSVIIDNGANLRSLIYNELATANTWYDAAFTYDYQNDYIELYLWPSGTTTFTNYLDGASTYGTSSIGSGVPAQTTWKNIILLDDYLGSGLGVSEYSYLQNIFIIDSHLSAMEFNTYRRWCYMWNNKTTGQWPK